MNLQIMAWSLGCQAYFFIFYLSCSGFFNPTFHAEAMKSNHLSLSLLRVTLVHPVPATVAVLPCGAPPPSRLGLASLGVLAPRPVFVPSISQLMVLGSKLSLLKIGSDLLGFAHLDSWFPFIRSLWWHSQLPLQIGQVLEKSTLEAALSGGPGGPCVLTT